MLQKLYFLMFAMCLLAPAHADHLGIGSAGPDTSAVNLAGETRMLSQRIARVYAQIGLDVMPTISRVQMHDAISRFEHILDVLEPLTAASPEASRAHQNLTQAWENLRAATTLPASRAAAFTLSRRSLVVLDGADRLTDTLERHSPGATSHFVNNAGRLRMLSQRLAKAYLLRSWGLDSSEVRAELAATAADFDESLASLVAWPGNSPAIRDELEEIELQWTWLQTVIAVEDVTFYRVVVAQAADSLLAATNYVARLYDQLHGQ